MPKLVILVLVLLCGAGCRLSDIRTTTIEVPGMVSEKDAQAIHKVLVQFKGVQADKVQCDIAQRQVHVTYDSMLLALKNMEVALAEIGYAANEVKALPLKPAP